MEYRIDGHIPVSNLPQGEHKQRSWGTSEPDDTVVGSNKRKIVWNISAVRPTDAHDVESLLRLMPAGFVSKLREHPLFDQLMEVSMDVGRKPRAYFHSSSCIEEGEFVVQEMDIQRADSLMGGKLSSKNRVVIDGTLHRIGKIVNVDGSVVGMTLRVGRAIPGDVTLLEDVVSSRKSILLLGKPGVGKTTMIRGIARFLSDKGRRVVIVDSCNEIAGNSDVPHSSIGNARRVQIPKGRKQSEVMIEVVENHTPEVMIIDEISCTEEVMNCRTIAERGVQLIATAHGTTFMNIIKNPVLNNLAGGLKSVTLSGQEVMAMNKSQRTVQERIGSPTFPITIELRNPNTCIVHWTKHSMDLLLRGDTLTVQLRKTIRNMQTTQMREYRSLLEEYEATCDCEPGCIQGLLAMNHSNIHQSKRKESPQRMQSRPSRRGSSRKSSRRISSKLPRRIEVRPRLSTVQERADAPSRSEAENLDHEIKYPSPKEMMDFMKCEALGKENLRIRAPYGCDLCSVSTPSLHNLYFHARGRKHARNMRNSNAE